MPRGYEMTWVPSRRLWRKVFRSVVYTVSCKQLREQGHNFTAESKEGSYIAANAWWHKTEFELEAQERAARRPPVPFEDVVAPLLEHLYKGYPSQEEMLGRPPTPEDELRRLRQGAMMLFQLYVLQGVPLPPEVACQIPPHSLTALDNLREAGAAPGKSVEEHAERWLKKLQAKVDAGRMTAARCANNRTCLEHLKTYLGASSDVSGITAQAVEGFYLHCLSQIAARRQDKAGKLGWSVAYARDVFAVARAFIRWLSDCDAIPLPKNLNSRSFDFGGSGQVNKTWTVTEFQKIVKAAPGKLKLAVLLMANTGMTQQDVSDLLDSEVDWSAGRVRRKRSKTRGDANVPEVEYLLWPVTFALLKQYRSGQNRVLLTEKGEPFVRTKLNDKGKLVKADGFASNYAHVQRRMGLSRPLKQLRKLGASLLASHEVYGRLVSYFLGHSPRTVADRHYTVPPQALLDEAVTWLGRQLGQVP
jgi:integrase